MTIGSNHNQSGADSQPSNRGTANTVKAVMVEMPQPTMPEMCSAIRHTLS